MELNEIAFNMFRESRGKLTSKEIAEKLDVKLSTVKYWRSKYNWKKKLQGGAKKGNKNAVGNKGGGASKENCNALKHGMYISNERFSSKKFLAKYLPKGTANIISAIEDSGLTSLEILWTNITIQLTAIIRSQKIMYVKSKKEMIKEIKKKETTTSEDEKYEKEELEFQFAWDRQATFLQAQSKAMKTLEGMINSYEKLLHTNWDLATEEQKARLELIKSQASKLNGDDLELEDLEDIEGEIYG